MDAYGHLLFLAIFAVQQLEKATRSASPSPSAQFAPYMTHWPLLFSPLRTLEEIQLAELRDLKLGSECGHHPKFGIRFLDARAAIAYALISFIYLAKKTAILPEHPDVTECKQLRPLSEAALPKWWTQGLKMLHRAFPDSEKLHWPGRARYETQKEFVDQIRKYFYEFAPEFMALQRKRTNDGVPEDSEQPAQ